MKRETLSLKKPVRHQDDGPRKPHPLVKFIGQRVVIQQRQSGARIEGLLVTFDQGWLTLLQACVTGSKFTVRPKNGEIVVAAQSVAHIHHEVVELEGNATC